ncbi:MAG: hypothetical protein HOB82_00345 [Alphaproteobacteria bacterium]|jgi:hypothetical protein|nr:hypothetical protein [Alphaproteobacteria bacterium]MBT4709967.1 hypothetical protein [Alphaproteobacteria bacterium]
MSTIEKIRRRVEKADQLLGASASQNRKYAQRLTRLLDQLEIEHEGRKVRTERLHLENDELRAMLLSLLLGIEAEGDLDGVLQGMEARMTALVNAAQDDGPELITHDADVIEGSAEVVADPDPAPEIAAPAGRPTLKQALDQLLELVADSEDAPPSTAVLSAIRSPAISEAVDLLRAAVSDGEPAAIAPMAEATPVSAPGGASEIEVDVPADDISEPISDDSLDSMDFDSVDSDPVSDSVEMEATDIDAMDFDAVAPEEAVEAPVDTDAADIDAMDFDAVGSDEAEAPEEPAKESTDSADDGEQEDGDSENGDPGIRKILDHVREEIEASRTAPDKPL